MERRKKEFAWLVASCGCGIKQLIKKRNAAAHLTVCLVHSANARKWVPQTVNVVMRVLRSMGLELQDHFQEWPVGTRDANGNFTKRMMFHIDLAFRLNDRLMAIEVHGGSEHANDKKAIQRDEMKEQAWAEEVAQQSATTSPQCVGPILVIWAPNLLHSEQGGAMEADEWEQWVERSVTTHIRTHMM